MNEEAMLSVAKKLRQEREREKELQTQKADQRTAIQHIDQRVARMEAQLKDSRQQVQERGRLYFTLPVTSGQKLQLTHQLELGTLEITFIKKRFDF